MLNTYLIIMAIVVLVIGLALAIKYCVRLIKSFDEADSFWCKLANCLNLLAVLTLSSGISLLFFTVAGVAK